MNQSAEEGRYNKYPVKVEKETMAKKLVTPYAPPRKGLPCEMKLDYAMGGYTGVFKACLYAIREKYGPAAALELYERVCTMDGRVKNFTNALLKTFKIEGNDLEAMAEWYEIYFELMELEGIWLERSKAINRFRFPEGCPLKTEAKDISDWNFTFHKIVTKTINPKAIFERPKGMCKGDPYCEYVWKIEEKSLTP